MTPILTRHLQAKKEALWKKRYKEKRKRFKGSKKEDFRGKTAIFLGFV